MSIEKYADNIYGKLPGRVSYAIDGRLMLIFYKIS
jgi:hypothetical protein